MAEKDKPQGTQSTSASAQKLPFSAEEISKAVYVVQEVAKAIATPSAASVLSADAVKAVVAQEAVKAVAQEMVKAIAAQEAVKAVVTQDAVKAVVTAEVVKAVSLVQEVAKAVAESGGANPGPVTKG